MRHNRIIYTLCLIFLPSLTWAQKDINGGIQVSPNYSLFNKSTKKFPQCTSCSGSPGFGIGYFETLELNDRWQLEANINYSENRFKNDENNELKVTYTVRYIDIPLLMRYKYGNFRLGLGYQYRYGLAGSQDSEFSSGEIQEAKDTGVVIDVGAQQGKMRFGLRYFRGSEEMVFVPSSISSLSLSIGWTLF